VLLSFIAAAYPMLQWLQAGEPEGKDKAGHKLIE
jgi:hypothetical protein